MVKKTDALICFMFAVLCSRPALAAPTESGRLHSPDGLNVIAVSLDAGGQLSYRVQRRGRTLIPDSPLGVRCDDQDFSRGLSLHDVGEDQQSRQTYSLKTGNTLHIDRLLLRKRLTFKNTQGESFVLELAASDQGVAFRCRVQDDDRPPRIVAEERTGFRLSTAATAWLQPYHAAGPYTPAYEDFYFRVAPGDPPPVSRGTPRGWCLPALFHLPSEQAWLLIAESGADGGYCGCHLATEPSSKGLYTIAFAYEDEVTGAKTFDPDARPAPVSARQTPWRLVILGDTAGDILTSTLITDLADPSQIPDPSWIKPGRASWAWWSHPDGPNTPDLFNRFTDLAADFGWEYTLFDAGWWTPGLDPIARHAGDKGVMPLVWAHAKDYYNAERRRRRLDEFVSGGVKGVKVDFWCSDRQAAMAAVFDTLKDAADRKLVVNLHGCTIPRGWHRTWPNLLTAEAVLGTESYFFDGRYPGNAAELNTILPFTRNVAAPMDVTPVALSIRKYPRKTTAAHELAAALVFTSGIVHYADSVEVFNAFPDEVKRVLRRAPAAWDETRCLIGDPGRLVVLARRTGTQWFIAGINGTDKPVPVVLELDALGRLTEATAITEGADPLMQFTVRKIKGIAPWRHTLPPFGGFVLEL